MANPVEITAQNTWTDVFTSRAGAITGVIDVMIEDDLANGTTVLVQRREVGQSTWYTIATVDAATEDKHMLLDFVGEWDFRVGVPTGGFSAGDSPRVGLRFGVK